MGYSAAQRRRSSATTSLSVAFNESVQVKFIPTIDDLNHHEIRATWYSRNEYKSIQERESKLVKRYSKFIKRKNKKEKSSDDTMQQHQQHNQLSPGDETILLNGLDTNEIKRLRRKRVSQIRFAVFQEQAQQKQMMELWQNQFPDLSLSSPEDDYSSSSGGSSDSSTVPGRLPEEGLCLVDPEPTVTPAQACAWPMYSPTAVSGRKAGQTSSSSHHQNVATTIAKNHHHHHHHHKQRPLMMPPDHHHHHHHRPVIVSATTTTTTKTTTSTSHQIRDLPPTRPNRS